MTDHSDQVRVYRALGLPCSWVQASRGLVYYLDELCLLYDEEGEGGDDKIVLRRVSDGAVIEVAYWNAGLRDNRLVVTPVELNDVPLRPNESAPKTITVVDPDSFVETTLPWDYCSQFECTVQLFFGRSLEECSVADTPDRLGWQDWWNVIWNTQLTPPSWSDAKKEVLLQVERWQLVRERK